MQKYLIVAFLFISITLRGQIITSDSLTLLQQVTISDKLLGTPFELKNRTGSANYVSSADIIKFNTTDVNRALRSIPGISYIEEDGFGLRPNISIRGTSPERSSKITLMEDGVLIAPAPYSAPAAYYFPTVGRMQAIEILKGSSQIQYGPFTTGGAINFLSQAIPDSFNGSIRLNAGNFATRSSEATVGTSTPTFGFLTQIFNYNSDGFKTLPNNLNTGFDKTDYLAKFRLNTKADARYFQALSVKIQYAEERSYETYLGLTQKDFEATPYMRYAASAKDKMEAIHSQLQATHFIKINPKINITTTVYRNTFARNWYKLDDVTLTKTVKIAELLANPQKFEDEYKALQGASSTPNDAFGIKANNRKYTSTGIQTKVNYRLDAKSKHNVEIGLRLHEDSEDRFQWKDKYTFQNKVLIQTTTATQGSDANSITSASAISSHILYKYSHRKLTVSPGIRYENITLQSMDYGKKDEGRSGVNLATKSNKSEQFIPGVGLNFRWKSNISFFGGIHQGFAPPSIAEGSKPEQSLNVELGTRVIKKGVEGEFTLYRNDYQNLLGSDLAASGGTGSLDLFNAGRALVQGIELSLGYILFKESTNVKQLRFPINVVYTLTNATFKNSFQSDEAIFGNVSVGDFMPYIPAHTASLNIGMTYKKLTCHVSGRAISKIRTLSGQEQIAPENLVAANTIFDANIFYEFKTNLSFSITSLNVLNSAYAVARMPAGLRPGAPRMLQIGIIYNFAKTKNLS